MHGSPKTLFVLLVLAAGGLSFVSQAAITVHAHESEGVAVIHITENGFEPDKLTIKPGTEVMFENVGQEEHWPASDDHPSHTLYDGTSPEEHCVEHSHGSFDACKALASGETWSFTFDREGVFKFHDHLWPHMDGEITVVENNENIFRRLWKRLKDFFNGLWGRPDAPVADVALTTGSYEELKGMLRDTVFQVDASVAIRTLRERAEQDAKVMALCHDLLHDIGHVAYEKYGGLEAALEYQEDFCNSGYIHGLLESYIGSVADPLAGLADQCSGYAAGKREFDLWQCHHGVGHGFMYYTGGDLDASLALCEDSFPLGHAASCQNGVYMEVFNLEILAKEPDFVDRENPFRTCLSRDAAKDECYVNAPVYFMQTLGEDASDVLKKCGSAEPGYKDICLQGVGAEIIKRNMGNISGAFALCDKGSRRSDRQECARGIVSMYMNQSGSYSAGEDLCASAPGHYQNACRETVEARKAAFRLSPAPGI